MKEIFLVGAGFDGELNSNPHHPKNINAFDLNDWFNSENVNFKIQHF